MLSGLDRDRLEAFRRQVEEDYKLDVAAIERIQRRYLEPSNTIPINTVPINPNPINPSPSNPNPSSSIPSRDTPKGFDSLQSPGTSSEWCTEQRTTILQPSRPAAPQNDELVDSLRSMFAPVRR
jgi:hypothetical protein